jgi:hypothetical protein
LALSNTRGEKEIYYSESSENIGTSSLIESKEIKDDQIEKINSETLDSLYDFKNKKIIMKIDVEEYENFVIKGSLDILKNNKILIYIETDDLNLLDQLMKIGYKRYFFKHRENIVEFTNESTGKDVILKNF